MTLLSQMVVLAAGEGGGGSALLSPEPGLMIWTWVTFACLFFVLAKFAWKPLMSGLEKRETTIRESIESAEKLKVDAEAMMRDYEEKIAQSKSEAHAIVEEGRRDAEVLRQDIEKKAQSESAAMIDRGRREIELARDKAVEEIRNEAVGLSLSIAEKILKKDVSTEENQKLAREALQSLGKGNRA